MVINRKHNHLESFKKKIQHLCTFNWYVKYQHVCYKHMVIMLIEHTIGSQCENVFGIAVNLNLKTSFPGDWVWVWQSGFLCWKPEMFHWFFVAIKWNLIYLITALCSYTMFSFDHIKSKKLPGGNDKSIRDERRFLDLQLYRSSVG